MFDPKEGGTSPIPYVLKGGHGGCWYNLGRLGTPCLLLLRISGLDSTECEIDHKKLVFLGTLLTQSNAPFAIFSMFSSNVDSFHDIQWNLSVLFQVYFRHWKSIT